MPPMRDDFRRAQWAVGSLFLLLGFQYATWVSRLPAVKARLDLSDAEVGLLLTVCGVGAAGSFPAVAALMRRLGSRGLCLASATLLSVLPLALGVAPDYPIALIIVCCDGVGVACLDVAMNAQGAELEERFQRKAMGKLHATFSAGSVCGALLASAVNAATSDLTVHFAVAAALILALLGYARRDLLKAPDAGPEQSPQAAAADVTVTQEPKKRRPRPPLPTRVTLWMGLAMVFGTVVEGAMNDWSALYLKSVAKAASSLTPMGIVVFSVAMVLARVFSDSWRKRWGDGPVVVLGSAVAGLGLAAAVLAGGVLPGLLGFACAGLGIAAVTPCVYVAAAGAGTDALALVAAMGTVGLLAGPGLIGLIASSAGLGWGMGAVALAAVAVAASTSRIAWTRPTVEAVAEETEEPEHAPTSSTAQVPA